MIFSPASRTASIGCGYPAGYSTSFFRGKSPNPYAKGNDIMSINRRHNHGVLLRLTDAEFTKLTRDSSKAGLTKSTYLRQLISKLNPVESPPLDYYKMMEQLYIVGNNLNQIAKKAQALSVIDSDKYDEAIKDYNEIIKLLSDAFIRPRKIK